MNSGESGVLIRALRESLLHDEGVNDVDQLETHMSWVLLAGQHAYKVKKPVDLGFADFTTLERRKYYCDEELRINVRFAPKLYLGVVQICGDRQNPELGGEGRPIEYAVKMLRFSQDALASKAIERGEIEGHHIDKLARDVADFHQRIEVAGPAEGYRSPEGVERPMSENLDRLEENEALSRRKTQLRRLRSWAVSEYEAKRTTFVARKADGFVRECHGDMHLGNMVLIGDEIVLFDAIEFNEEFRWVDVISDIAFTVMDLEDRGRKRLARRFLNAYLEHTGDYAGLAVLPFYLTYRALVRAMVDAIRMVQTPPLVSVRTPLRKAALNYLDLAERHTQDSTPELIITYGPAGSGKSTLARQLVESLGVIQVRSDIERQRMFEVEHALAASGSGAGVGQGIYSPRATRACYERLGNIAAAVLHSGNSVIVDATFQKHSQRSLFAELADQVGAPFRILDFQADRETLERRVNARAATTTDASEADEAVLERQLENMEPLSGTELARSVVLDARQPEEALAEFAASRLNESERL